MTDRDRIAEPWGARTPYESGGIWPTRVDTYLADGMSDEQVYRWAQSASILHSNGDALDIAVSGGQIVRVRGRGVDRVNHGRLGPKDLFGWQANAAADRLISPLIRERGQLVEPTGTPRWTGSCNAARSCSMSRGRARWASIPLASCFWRSTTRWG